MSDGNKFAASAYAQQRHQSRLPFESMGNVLLDAMQGTLVCLDNSHVIVAVSKTIKRYFGFEQTELIGLSILLLVEDSERDAFLKYLNNPTQSNDTYNVRMTMNNIHEYRQVNIHRKKKFNNDNANVHSTTARLNSSVGTILIITLDDSSYIDITLHDIHKQEFYTKINLTGEIIFEDHRGALITGYLPREIISQSIFDFVFPEDRLVKLHALWKCVTTGSSKLQWRFNARDGSLVFLQTEYKLITDPQKHDVIMARNEVLNPIQRSQFDELQTAWKHQCAADIKGNSASFKFLSQLENEVSSATNGPCRIWVPALSMCFTTDKLQPLAVQGNIFGVSKVTSPLVIQDYIHILIEHDTHMDPELANTIKSIQSLAACYRRSNDKPKSQQNGSDVTMNERVQSDAFVSTDPSLRQKTDADSIVRGILSKSIKTNHEKPSGDLNSTLARLLNGNGHTAQNGNTRSSTASQFQSSPNSHSPEPSHQQDMEFLKKYKAAKAKLESQLEVVRRQEMIDGQASDPNRKNIIINKLSQLENIRNRHFARRHIQKRPAPITTTAIPVNNPEQKDFLNSLFSSSSPKSMGLLPMDTSTSNTLSSIPSPLSSLLGSSNDQSSFYQQNYPDQRSVSQQFDLSQNSIFDDFLTPPPSLYTPVNNHTPTSLHANMNVSYPGATNDSTSPSPFPNLPHNPTYPF